MFLKTILKQRFLTYININLLSLSIVISEFLCFSNKSFVIVRKFSSDVSFQRVISVRIFQKGYNTLNNKFSIQGRNPVVFNGLSADFASILLDIGVIDLGLEENLVKKYININNLKYCWFVLPLGIWRGNCLRNQYSQ